MTIIQPISVTVSCVKNKGIQKGIKNSTKEILRKNPTIEKDLVDMAQKVPKGSNPLDIIIKELKKIGIITEKNTSLKN